MTGAMHVSVTSLNHRLRARRYEVRSCLFLGCEPGGSDVVCLGQAIAWQSWEAHSGHDHVCLLCPTFSPLGKLPPLPENSPYARK